MSTRDGAPKTAPLAQVERTSMAEQAYRAIRASMISGQFEPGTQLIETRLASALGISRGPVREALGRLRDEGLVEEVFHRGTFVREFNVRDLVDIYNLRLGIESVAIALATRQRSDTRALRQVKGEMAASARAGDLAAVTDAEVRFHHELCVASGNGYVVSAFDGLSGQLQMALSLDYSATSMGIADIPEDHEPLIDAVETQTEAVAVERLEAHILKSVDPVIARLCPGEQAREMEERLLRGARR
jgi:DNA-binding GntR family transcriptional regulator